MKIDLTTFELHNVVKTASGDLRTRRGFADHLVAAAGTVNVAAFSIESPQTTEVWHYVFTQDVATLVVTLNVMTEEYVSLFTFPCGTCPRDPVISHAVVNRMVSFNSPSFSVPIWGYVGGGLMPMTRIESDSPSTTALDIPTGHTCSFGDRLVVTQGSLAFINDSRQDLDPRSFVAQNSFALPGVIYDAFQGADGALSFFTSDGLYMMPVDAIGQGMIQGFVSKVIPQVLTNAPKNAAPTSAGVVVLQRDGVLVVNGASQQVLPLPRFEGRRKLSRSVDVEDLRTFGQVFPTPTGALVGFSRRDYHLMIDLQARSFSWIFGGSSKPLVGVLMSRDGEPIHVFADRIAAMVTTGPADNDGSSIEGMVCGRIDVDITDNPLIRRVTVGAANAGEAIGAAVAPNIDTGNQSPFMRGDFVIGSSTWDEDGPQLQGRSTHTTRMTVNVRSSEPHLEVVVGGGNRRIKEVAELQAGGLSRSRKDRQE